ncbi:PAS sensor protein [Nitrosococcus halophilus Nc 4]|uniref:histidine kinase n=1 Tax=Nitrosococcus halophilus (strain Nc4) TaxID=472759 RepID=D5C3N2_NITHN|nr:CheR family methyltransferase [Nitrosococcus halophilus]ADE15004.1 PAS sensor protein [Nitrosococcus halophilus Nc 4]
MKRTDFPIVGIGASAGGLDSLKQLFNTLPDDSGMAFVLIQHLDPTHESLIVELLSRCTRMKVVQVKDQMPVEVNRVYAIPPNKFIAIRDRFLYLSEPVLSHGIRMPIDFFLRSLAEDQEEKAISIILSGTGSDGALGIKAIKNHGGMVMVQDPKTAQYEGMPSSAIVTGLVDFIQPVEDMPGILLQYTQHAYIKTVSKTTEAPSKIADTLHSILSVLRAKTKYDFRYYKKGTLLRRINRRLGLHHIEDMSRYLNFLRDNSTEATQLFKDLLIGVTGFFREEEAFKVLEEQVIAKLVQKKSVDAPIRVWVPACSTGEEPYSIAILLTEQIQAAKKNCPLQIFATDIDTEALEIARTGIYPENIAADISSERLRRFFIKENHTYQINKPIRESVLFAEQNLITDPPFSKLDLISCRNLLIYLEAEIQKKLIALFHFALNPGGYLFLGSTETISHQEGLFTPLSKKWRVYQRIGAIQHHLVEFPIAFTGSKTGDIYAPAPPRPSEAARLAELTQKALLEDYAPASVLVNPKYRVLYFYGPTDRYLRQPTGIPTDDLLTRIREGLHLKLRAALHRATQEKQQITVPNAHIRAEGTYHRVKITVKPLQIPKTTEKLLLVSFQEEPERMLTEEHNTEVTAAEETLIRHLEQELKTTKTELHSTIEELETSNEELKAANEEIMSMNEELQSTNEELETSKEELQSLNEELNTVNSQLQDKVEELTVTNNDLANLLQSPHITTLFLDREFRIKRYTPTITQLFNLIPTDIGRPISHIVHKFSNREALLKEAATVLENLKPMEQEVHSDEDRWYIQRILPYQTEEHHIGGVVVTFIDITQRKQIENERQRLLVKIERERDKLRTLIDGISDEVWFCDAQGHLSLANRAAATAFGVERTEALYQPLSAWLSRLEIYTPEGQPRTLEEAPLWRSLQGETLTHVEEIIRHPQTRQLRSRQVSSAPLKTKTGEIMGAVAIARDITEEKEIETALREAKEKAVQASIHKSQFLATASHDLRQPLQTLSFLNDSLTEKLKDPEIRRLIDQQGALLRNMGDLLNTLLDINKLEAGMVKPQFTVFPVASLLNYLRNEFELHAREKGLNLRMVPCSVMICSDRILLEQILENLLSNAIKHTDRGKILLGCRRRSPNLRIEVWDTGIGIPQEQLKVIFQEFYQADNPARDQRRGLGLGLSIVERLAHLLDHSLDIRSTPGKGSMFAIEVPMAKENKEEPRESPPVEPPTESSPSHTPVLLIEDDPAISDALRLYLEMSGFQLTTATHGNEALAQLEKGDIHPAVIISDYRLPGDKTGVQVIQHLRHLLGHRIPAIILTGDTSPDWLQEAKEFDCQVHHKPIGGSQLVTIIQQLIRDARFSH